ncbi:MAG: hypothetical protein ACREPR_14345 [Brasilonema sp.]
MELLKQEYFFLQTTIEDYNKQIWVIKALGITGTGAAIALMLQFKLWKVAVIGCTIPLFFWILESQWKHFQRGFYPRVAEIEAIFSRKGLCSPSIYTTFCQAFKRTPITQRSNYWRDGLFNRSVSVSYILEIVFLLILAAIAPKFLR